MTKDGTAEFIAVDARAAAIFDLIYPVGSIFATTGNAPARGTWEEIAKGRTLQGADSGHAAGTMIAAGLPNITGRRVASWGGGDSGGRGYTTGGFKQDADKNIPPTINGENWNGDGNGTGFAFDASLSNPIYGNSTTVQPPAYVVHFYRRIA